MMIIKHKKKKKKKMERQPDELAVKDDEAYQKTIKETVNNKTNDYGAIVVRRSWQICRRQHNLLFLFLL